MKIVKQIIIIGLCLGLNSALSLSAAKIKIEAPNTVSANRAPLSLSVILDNEGGNISGFSGDFSFPSELFDVMSIETKGGVVPLWGEAPHISSEYHFDGRTHVNFEGIIPGGFTGVRSAYSTKGLPGILFTITLIPKTEGRGTFLVNEVKIHNYDENATVIGDTGDSSIIVIPKLIEVVDSADILKEKVSSDSLLVTFNHSEMVENNASYLYINESDPSRAIDYILIAESNKYNSSLVRDYEWQRVSNPYILQGQNRNKFIHIKVFYTNNTYAIKTIEPVENLSSTEQLSRILIGILIAILLLLYYAKNNLHFFSKSHRS
jgi:hypothetical protein